MVCVCSKFIPKLLTDEQKNCRVEIAQDNLEMINKDENLLKKVIMATNLGFTAIIPKPNISLRSRSMHLLQTKKVHQNWSNVKSMLIVFFDYVGVVHQSYENIT